MNSFITLIAHEGHDHSETLLQGFGDWFGHYHVIFLHFPIALIYMSLVSELLYALTKDSRYTFVSTFLLVSAAFFAIPTVISGLLYANSATYTGTDAMLIDFHRIGGLFTLAVTLLAASLNLLKRRNILYYGLLSLLFIIVTATTYIGGELAF